MCCKDGILTWNKENILKLIHFIIQPIGFHLGGLFYHTITTKIIRQCITKDACEFLIHAFITTRLQSVNAIQPGLLKFIMEKLQSVQIFSAGLITGSNKYDHIIPVLKSLHCPEDQQRTKYKIAVLSYKCFLHLPWPICKISLSWVFPEVLEEVPVTLWHSLCMKVRTIMERGLLDIIVNCSGMHCCLKYNPVDRCILSQITRYNK